VGENLIKMFRIRLGHIRVSIHGQSACISLTHFVAESTTLFDQATIRLPTFFRGFDWKNLNFLQL
jgi:hypothetical protein